MAFESIIRFLLFAFNLICALAGLALLIVGVLYKLNVTEVTNIIPGDFSALSSLPILLIVVGSVVFIIAFFGCYGALKESSCMLTTYGIIMLVIFVLQAALGVVAFLQYGDEGDAKTLLTEVLKKEFNKTDVSTKKIIDFMQQNLKCCGPDGASWYTESPLPESCCKENGNCTKEMAWPDGCADELVAFMTKSANTIGITAICLAAVELLGAIFAFTLSNSLKNW